METRDSDTGGRNGRYALRCVCGRSILCEVRPGGERIGFLVFYDGDPASESYGVQVKNCPACGRRIGLPTLLRENRLD